jgi:hypothetical protein
MSRKKLLLYFPIIIGGFLLIVSMFLAWREFDLPNGNVALENGLGWNTTDVAIPLPRQPFNFTFVFPDYFTDISFLLFIIGIVLATCNKLMSSTIVFILSSSSLVYAVSQVDSGNERVEVILIFGIFFIFLGIANTTRQFFFVGLISFFSSIYFFIFLFVVFERVSNSTTPLYSLEGTLVVERRASASTGQEVAFIGALLILVFATLPVAIKFGSVLVKRIRRQVLVR